MISTARLRSRLADHWVACDGGGEILDIEIPGDIGPAALLVTPVTDALKEVGETGEIIGSVDRSSMWSVEAIVLNSIALDRLDDREMTAEDLIEAVRATGLVWQIRPISDP